MSKRVNIGIIGAGRIGQLHARNLFASIPGAHIVAISDVIPEAAQKCAAECHIPKAVTNYQQLLDSKGIDAIIICSPTATHAQLIEEGAQAGKHIFCEKPIAFDLKLIDQALAAVDQAGVKLQIGFNRRFDPSFQHAKNMVSAGKIGTPHMVRITSRDPEAPPVEYIKTSGGLFLDMTIHDFDMCRYLLGEEVTEVFAVGNTLVDPVFKEAGDIDTAVVTLTYQSGAFCVIDNSRQAVYGYDQRIEVFGSEGCVAVGNRFPYDGTLYSKETVTSPLPLYFFLERYNESFVEEMRQFIHMIQQDTESPVSGVDGKIPVVMGLAAQESLVTHQPVEVEIQT